MTRTPDRYSQFDWRLQAKVFYYFSRFILINGCTIRFIQIRQPQFYPNPTTGNIHFEGFINEKSLSTFNLYDVSGKLIEQISLNPGNIYFNFQLYTKGIFYFEIMNQKGLVQHGKIVVV